MARQVLATSGADRGASPTVPNLRTAKEHWRLKAAAS
jgi:hypothetical protein